MGKATRRARRALAFALAVAMVLGMLPTAPLAEALADDAQLVVLGDDGANGAEGDEIAVIEPVEPMLEIQEEQQLEQQEGQLGGSVASVTTAGGTTTSYDNFDEAVNAWFGDGAGATLKLNANVETAGLPVFFGTKENPMVLDLNGHGILLQDDAGSVINVMGGYLELTDTDTSEPKPVHYLTLDESGRAISVSNESSDGSLAVSGGYIAGGKGSASRSTISSSTFGGGVFITEGFFPGQVSGFTMSGGTIIGNSASNGGGVCIEKGTFNMTGGTITGNTASSRGGGVDHYPSKTFTVSGSAKITGNMVGGKANNVFMEHNFFVDDNDGSATLNVGEGGLTEGAEIGITMMVPGVFTKGSTDGPKASDYKDFFKSDSAAYSVGVDGNELRLEKATFPYLIWDETNKALVEQTGNNACKDYELVTAETTTFNNGEWYVVAEDTTVDNSISVMGTAHLILCDGATLTATKGVAFTGIIETGVKVGLVVHAQSGKSGKLIASGGSQANDEHPSISFPGALTVDGGIIECAGDGTASIFIGGDIAINGADVKAKNGILTQGSVAINDGKVSVTDGRNLMDGNPCGILAAGDVAIAGDDAVVHAVSTAAQGGYGIAMLNGSLTVDGGEVQAFGRVAGAFAANVELGGGKIDIAASGIGYGVCASGTIAIGPGIGKNGGYAIVSGGRGAFADVEGNPVTVKNAVPGIGWTDAEGTQGKEAIEPNAEGQTLDYKRVLFPAASAVVTKAPTARALTRNGKAQELVTAGKATDGAMQYALGADAASEPIDGWSASVPTATEAGTYFVWYKAVGDNGHTDSEAACVKATIAKKAEPAPAVTVAKAAKPFTMAHPTKGTIDVSWKAAKGAKTYQVQWRAAGASKWTTKSVKGREYTIKGLKAGTLYQVRVRGVAGTTRGGWSKVTRRWLRAAARVRAATGKKAGTIKVSWSKVAKANAGYRIYVYAKKEGKVVKTVDVAKGKTSATVGGLKAGKTYYVRMRPYRRASGATYIGTICGYRTAKAAR